MPLAVQVRWCRVCLKSTRHLVVEGKLVCEVCSAELETKKP